MKSKRDVERSIQDMNLDTNPTADQRVLQDVLQAQASHRHWGLRVRGNTLKRAVAAVVLIGIGCALAQLARPRAVDLDALTQQVVASLQSSMQAEIETQVKEQLARQGQTYADAELDHLTEALYQKVAADLSTATGEILTAYDAGLQTRLLSLTQQLEAARRDDRRWIRAALDHLEGKRLQDRQQLKTGLLTLAARTYDLMDQEQTQPDATVH